MGTIGSLRAGPRRFFFSSRRFLKPDSADPPITRGPRLLHSRSSRHTAAQSSFHRPVSPGPSCITSWLLRARCSVVADCESQWREGGSGAILPTFPLPVLCLFAVALAAQADSTRRNPPAPVVHPERLSSTVRSGPSRRVARAGEAAKQRPPDPGQHYGLLPAMYLASRSVRGHLG